jgi:hypothetical protein
MRSISPLAFLVALATVAAWTLAAPTLAAAQDAPPDSPAVAKALDSVRAAIRRFQNLDTAAAAGYSRDVPACLVHEHHGAMGYHHTNPSLADAEVETQRPEMLLFERLPGGAYRLNGVEYIVPYRAWPRDSTPPVALGQRMRHEDNLQLWYLHAWVFTANPDGVFADFNPDVQCPAAASRVFKPFARP